MDKETVKDELEFLEGSLNNLDSLTFFYQIQAETFKFHSVPRFEREIEAFQIEIHEMIKTFINLNELMLVHHDSWSHLAHWIQMRGKLKIKICSLI